MAKKPLSLRTRADVEALPIPLSASAVLHWLLGQPARVYERLEISTALGAKASEVERELVRMQRRDPVLLARHDAAGAPIRGRHGYIPADSPLRAAWANKGEFAEARAADPYTAAGDAAYAKALAEGKTETEAGALAMAAARAADSNRTPPPAAPVEGDASTAHTDQREPQLVHVEEVAPLPDVNDDGNIEARDPIVTEPLPAGPSVGTISLDKPSRKKGGK